MWLCVWSRGKGTSRFKAEVKITAMACPAQRTSHTGMENSLWKGPQEVCSPICCAKQGQLWAQTRLPRAISSRGLKHFPSGDGPASLHNLFQCPAVLMGKKSILLSSLNFSCVHCRPIISYYPTRHSCEEPGSISLMTDLWAVGLWLVRSLHAIRSPGWTSPSALAHRTSAPTLSISLILSWIHSRWLMPSLWHFAFQRWLHLDFDTASVQVLSH